MQTEKQRERLVELITEFENNLRVKCPKYDEPTCDGCEYDLDHECDKTSILADYLMSNNVLVLAFEKGDIVYHLAHGYAEEEIVRCSYLQYLTNGYSFTEEDIGKTVFLSRAEAEAKLNKRSNENA